VIRELYDDHAGALHNYFVKLGHSGADAEDIVQETMLRAWRHVETIDLDQARPWLFTVARRVAIDMHRKRAVRPVTVPGDFEVGGGGVADGGIQRIIDRETCAEVLAALPRAQREVLVLRHICNLTVHETAEQLGIPPGTVRSREFYARRLVGAR
jgi:RNA polymerase sigma-70 factor (ECF subfamily)